MINASDAASILKEAALRGATGKPSFRPEQSAAGDVNKDGSITASDAAAVLAYAAAYGAGKPDIRVEDFAGIARTTTA